MADDKTQKRKRFSKNKKKYWKKHADVNDVEEFLEDQRLQERTGGLVGEKADEQIFFVDTAAVNPAATEEEEVTQRKKRRREVKPLRCHASLQPDPHTKPARVKTSVRKSRPEPEPVKSKRLLRERNAQRQQATQQRTTRATQGFVQQASYDLWDKPREPDTSADRHYLKTLNKVPKKPPPRFHDKPSGVAAVEVIHPGASYNPTYEDHQDLLATVIATEVKKETAAKRLKRALDDAFPDKRSAPTEADRQAELAEGLFEESESSSDEGEDERLSVNPVVRREDKKTEKQRSKELKVRQTALRQQREKQERTTRNQVYRIKTSRRQVKTLLEMQEARRTRNQERKLADKDQPKTLGKHKYVAPDLEVKLSDEIHGSLRLLKPEGHLLEDRFKSLQKRNIIEPRGRAKVTRKFKLKKFVKKTHRNVV